MGSRFWSGVAGILLGVLVTAPGAHAEAQPVAYVGLKSSLVRQGLDKDYIAKTFADPRNQFLPDVVKKIAYLGKESRDIYKKFMTPETAARGRAYMEAHRATLSRAEAKYGVAPEVIVGILTVESGLGTSTGKYPVFNVFASLAVMDTPEVIQEVGLTASRDRLKKKAAWARRELAVLPGILRLPTMWTPFPCAAPGPGPWGTASFSLPACSAVGWRRTAKARWTCSPTTTPSSASPAIFKRAASSAKTAPPGSAPSIATITPTPTWTRC